MYERGIDMKFGANKLLIYALAAVLCLGFSACDKSTADEKEAVESSALVSSESITTSSSKSDVLINAASEQLGANHAATPGMMTREEALEAVLAHVGLSQNDVFDVEIEIEADFGERLHYDVEFKTATHEFDYEVDAYYGEVMKAKREAHDFD